jgi:uncharacterized protein YdaL
MKSTQGSVAESWFARIRSNLEKVAFVISDFLRRPAAVALGAAVLAVAAVPAAMAASSGSVAAHPAKAAHPKHVHRSALVTNPHAPGELPSPPKPPAGLAAMPRGFHPPTALPKASGQAQTTAATLPAQAKTWGAHGSTTTLVLYDSTGTWGWLGELYAIGAGNLATHFGTVTAEPVADYLPGQVNNYTSTIYLGSTYNEPLPSTFLNDVLSTSKPVIWAGDNIWQLSGAAGSATDTAFQNTYGWDPSTSYFDTADSVGSVGYKAGSFTRSLANAAGVLAPHVTNSAAVNVLATANCAATCAGIAQTTGNSFPWAVSSGNLTYVGEIPFSYMSLTDRYVAFSDLLFRALAPSATASHLALVRLEDISPASSPANLTAMAAYLKTQNVPFSMAVIPQYTDPKGYYNNGTPQTESLLQQPAMAAALRTAVADGGTLVQHGYTHQYSNVDNPFTGVTGDDFEFYRAQCSTTATAPYTFHALCSSGDSVIETGPLPGDSQLGTYTRVLTGRLQFTLAGLPEPAVWTTPHYAASAADYAGIGQLYSTRYEQELFFGGQLTGGAINYSHPFGQFFPYEVHDLYGATIVPENLGDYEPTAQNNNPPRLASDILSEGALNLSVTQGVASFFVHPDDDPMSVLQQLVTGLKSQGYTFVSPQTFVSDNG